MSVKGGLVAHLKADAGVSAIVGTKVYPIPIPQGKDAPYLVYQRRSTESERDLSGASGLRRTEFQLDAYSASPAEADTLAEAVRTSLDNWSGTWAGTAVKRVIFDEFADTFSADPDGGEEGLHRIVIDIIVWHAESMPNA